MVKLDQLEELGTQRRPPALPSSSEWIADLLEVPVLLMDGGAFLGAVLKNHLLSPDIEAQVLWAAKVDLLPAGVLQVLGERERLLAQLEDVLLHWELRDAELTVELSSGGNLQILGWEGVVGKTVSHSQVHKHAV